MRTVRLVALLSLALVLSSCARMQFYTRPDLSGEETGIKFFTPRPYLLVARTGSEEKPVDVQVLYLPDLSKPIYAKASPGYGSADVSIALSNGMLTNFGSKTDSNIPGLLTALGGLDKDLATAGKTRNPSTPAPVALWSTAANAYVPVGQSVVAVSGWGTGSPGDFGFSDAALVTCQDQELLQRAQTAPAMRTLSLPKLGELVGGVSAAGRRNGRVQGVEKILQTTYTDVVIDVSAPGVFVGDSGMLWVGTDGSAVAIHSLAPQVAPGQGSPTSAAMSAGRVARLLKVQLHASWG